MNKVILLGRMVRDAELKMTASGASVCAFSVACDRPYTQDGERKADFINCVAWRQQAEFIAKHFRKGDRIALDGSIQTRSWNDQNGNKRYATEVIVDHAEFGGSSASQDRMGADERLTAPMSTPPASARGERSASGTRWTAAQSKGEQGGGQAPARQGQATAPATAAQKPTGGAASIDSVAPDGDYNDFCSGLLEDDLPF